MFKKIIILLVIGITTPAVAYCQSDVRVSKSLIRHGLKMYDQGYYSIAVSDFSNALLLQSENPQIEKKLIALNSDKNLSADIRFHLLHFEDLIKNIDITKRKISYYGHENAVLARKLINADRFDDALLDQFEEINARMQDITENQLYLLNDNFNKMAHPLVELNKSLKSKNEYLSGELLSLRAQNEVLQEHMKAGSNQLVVHQKRSSSKWSYARNYYENRKKASISLASDLGKEQITNVKDGMLDGAIDENNFQDVQKSIAIFEDQETVIQADSALVQNLNNEILELESRVELGKKIITEKDEQIEHLRASVIRLEGDVKLYRKELDGVMISNNREIAETNELLRITTIKLEEANDTIDSINKKYNQLAQKIDAMQEDHLIEENKPSHINTAMKNIGNTFPFRNIRSTFFNKEEDMGQNTEASVYELRNIIASKDEKLIELSGIMQIYKAKLSDTNKSLQISKQEIIELKDDLVKKDDIIVQAKGEIAQLKSRIGTVEKQLQELREEKNRQGAKLNIQDDVKDLQEKLTEVNKFLAENLKEFGKANNSPDYGDLDGVNRFLKIKDDYFEE